MVRVGDMLKKKKSLWIQTNDDEARAMFRSHATAIPEQGESTIELITVTPCKRI
jgi:hypothetical protein